MTCLSLCLQVSADEVSGASSQKKPQTSKGGEAPRFSPGPAPAHTETPAFLNCLHTFLKRETFLWCHLALVCIGVVPEICRACFSLFLSGVLLLSEPGWLRCTPLLRRKRVACEELCGKAALWPHSFPTSPNGGAAGGAPPSRGPGTELLRPRAARRRS